MIFLLAGIILAFYMVYEIILKNDDSFIGVIFFTIISFFISLLTLFFTIPIALLIGFTMPQFEKINDEYHLVALRDAIGLQGNFFLGYGSVHDQAKYYFYKKTNDNGLQLDSVDASDATVYQDEQTNPYIVEHAKDFKKNWYYLFGLPIGIFSQDYKIHIPPNSVLQGYNLNIGKQ